jgi:hypothetical protein
VLPEEEASCSAHTYAHTLSGVTMLNHAVDKCEQCWQRAQYCSSLFRNNTDLAKGTLNVDSKKTCDTYRISRLFNGERTNFRVMFSYVTGPSTDISGGCGSIAI